MPTTDPLIGQQLGDYTIRDIIGYGGMGRVYTGYDEKLQRYAAVKVFDAQGVLGDDLNEYRERFQREARAVARLRHPYIVDVYQFGQTGSLYYMAMTLVKGRDLRTILRERNLDHQRMSPEEIVRIVTDVASALDYAHAEGVIHRDVKPSNIMIMADGHAMLTDFGLALSVPEGTIGTTFGSVHYIAPEQAMNSAMAVPQSDLYSLGVVLYEMLAGRVPFDDTSAMSVALKHLSDPPPPLRLYRPEITPELEAMVLHALDKDPERRYSSGDAFVQALERAIGLTDVDDDTRKLVIPDWVKQQAQQAAAPAPAAAQPIHKIEADTSGSKATTPASAPPASPTAPSIPSRRPVYLAATVLIAVTLIVGAVLLVSAGVGSSGTDETPQSSATEPITATPAAAALQASLTPTTPPTQPPTEATPASAVPTHTPTRQPEPTTEPAQPQPAAATHNGSIRLIYNESWLVLLNQSDTPQDISGLTFIQRMPTGPNREFPSRRWSGGSAALNALPAGDCFQVFTTNVIVQDPPQFCQTRHKWDQAAETRWFWINKDLDTVFEIRRGSALIAECRVGAGECTFDVNAASE